MSKQSLIDQLIGLFSSAVEDVRGKVIEEGWFGRGTAPNPGELHQSNQSLHSSVNVNIDQRSVGVDIHGNGGPAEHGERATPWDEFRKQIPTRAYELEQERGIDRDVGLDR